MRVVQLLTFVTICVIVSCCELHDNRLVVVNRSGHEVALQEISSNLPTENQLNDASYYLVSLLSNNSECQMIAQGRNGWKDMMSSSKDGKLYIVVLHADTLRKYRNVGMLLDKNLYSVLAFDSIMIEKLKWRVEIIE